HAPDFGLAAELEVLKQSARTQVHGLEVEVIRHIDETAAVSGLVCLVRKLTDLAQVHPGALARSRFDQPQTAIHPLLMVGCAKIRVGQRGRAGNCQYCTEKK